MSSNQELRDGKWCPAIPLPFYNGLLWWFTRGRFRCECGARFWGETGYRLHWLYAHSGRESFRG